MSVMGRLASSLGVNSDVPNQELAALLARAESIADIEEIAHGAWNAKSDVQSDCIKVLYEIGYIKPKLIARYARRFLDLLSGKNNRLIWGAMIALSTISRLKADDIYKRIGEVYSAMEKGSVITVDNGIRVLSGVASANEEYNKGIFPFLLNHLKTCRAKEIPQHAESIVSAVSKTGVAAFIQTIQERENELTPAQLKRIRKLEKRAFAGDRDSRAT